MTRLIRIPVVIGLIFLLFSAYLSWSNDRLVAEIKQKRPLDAIQEFDSVSFPILLVEPLKLLLHKASSQASIDNHSVIELLKIYLRRRPFDSGAWLIASQFYQRIGEMGLATQSLSVAHALSDSNTSILLKVFNRYLELGLTEKAMFVAHDISYARPEQFRRLFYLMTRLSDNTALVVDTVIPKKPPLNRRVDPQEAYQSSIFYTWALYDAIRADNSKLAESVWESMPSLYKVNNLVGIRYLNYLVKFQEINLIKGVWSDFVGEDLKESSIINTGYDELSPCWHSIDVNGVKAEVNLSQENDSIISLHFSGDENVGYTHMSCLVAVKEGARYKLVGRWKGEDITTLSGPYIDIIAPGVKSFYARTDGKTGNWPWSNFELEFNIPDNIEVIRVRLRRNKTSLIDSKISGVVQFDSFKLFEINSAAE